VKTFNELVEDMLIGSEIITTKGNRIISGIWPNQDFSQPIMVDFREGGTGQVHQSMKIFLPSELSEVSQNLLKKNRKLYRRLSISEFQDRLKDYGFEHVHKKLGDEGVDHWRISLGHPEHVPNEYYNILFHADEAWLDVVFFDGQVKVLISYPIGEFEFSELADSKGIETGATTMSDVLALYKLFTKEELVNKAEWTKPDNTQAEGRAIRSKWVWYHHQGHTRPSYNCDYVKYTEVGHFAVSTIGECWVMDLNETEVVEVPFPKQDENDDDMYYQTKVFLITERDKDGKPTWKKQLNVIYSRRMIDAEYIHIRELNKIDDGVYNDK
jgi:hypothetical protein